MGDIKSGKITSLVYSLIRDSEYDKAINILEVSYILLATK